MSELKKTEVSFDEYKEAVKAVSHRPIMDFKVLSSLKLSLKLDNFIITISDYWQFWQGDHLIVESHQLLMKETINRKELEIFYEYKFKMIELIQISINANHLPIASIYFQDGSCLMVESTTNLFIKVDNLNHEKYYFDNGKYYKEVAPSA